MKTKSKQCQKNSNLNVQVNSRRYNTEPDVTATQFPDIWPKIVGVLQFKSNVEVMQQQVQVKNENSIHPVTIKRTKCTWMHNENSQTSQVCYRLQMTRGNKHKWPKSSTIQNNQAKVMELHKQRQVAEVNSSISKKQIKVRTVVSKGIKVREIKAVTIKKS